MLPPLAPIALPVTLAPEASPPPPKPARRWYGWQILAPVGVGDALFWIAAIRGGKGSGPVVATGALMHMLSGSIVHLGHRQWAKAGASLGVNVGAPLALGVVGMGFGYVAALANDHRTTGGDSGLVLGELLFGSEIGVLLGGMAATVLDSMALAYEPIDTKPTARALPGASFSLVPMIGSGRAGIGVGGVF
ncbi:MAG: hypothetical protein ABI193_03415 [Minicystis sp.]